MKYLMIMTWIAVLSSSRVSFAGNESGHGSDTQSCDHVSGQKPETLIDAVLAVTKDRPLKMQDIISISPNGVNQKSMEAEGVVASKKYLDRLYQVTGDTNTIEQMKSWLTTFNQHAKWQEGTEEYGNSDYGHLSLPKGCKPRRLVNRFKDVLNKTQTDYEISNDLMQALTPEEQLMVPAHEVLAEYSESMMLQETNQLAVMLNGWIATDTLNSIPKPLLMKVLYGVGIKTMTINGKEIRTGHDFKVKNNRFLDVATYLEDNHRSFDSVTLPHVSSDGTPYAISYDYDENGNNIGVDFTSRGYAEMNAHTFITFEERGKYRISANEGHVTFSPDGSYQEISVDFGPAAPRCTSWLAFPSLGNKKVYLPFFMYQIVFNESSDPTLSVYSLESGHVERLTAEEVLAKSRSLCRYNVSM